MVIGRHVKNNMLPWDVLKRATVGERISDCSSDEGEMKVPLRNKDMNRCIRVKAIKSVVMHVLDKPGETEPFGKPGSGLDSVRIGKGDTSNIERIESLNRGWSSLLQHRR